MAANLIEGSLKEVIRFLDGLTSEHSQTGWNQAIASVDWARILIRLDENTTLSEDKIEGGQ